MKPLLTPTQLIGLGFEPQPIVKDDEISYQNYTMETSNNCYLEVCNDLDKDGNVKSQGIAMNIEHDDTAIDRRVDKELLIRAVVMMQYLKENQ